MNSPATIDGRAVIASLTVRTKRENRPRHLGKEQRAHQAERDGEGERQRDLLERADHRVQIPPRVTGSSGPALDRSAVKKLLCTRAVRPRLTVNTTTSTNASSTTAGEAVHHHHGQPVPHGGGRLVEADQQRVGRDEQQPGDDAEAEPAVEGGDDLEQHPGQGQSGHECTGHGADVALAQRPRGAAPLHDLGRGPRLDAQRRLRLHGRGHVMPRSRRRSGCARRPSTRRSSRRG
jgi:hypothetical protein